MLMSIGKLLRVLVSNCFSYYVGIFDSTYQVVSICKQLQHLEIRKKSAQTKQRIRIVTYFIKVEFPRYSGIVLRQKELFAHCAYNYSARTKELLHGIVLARDASKTGASENRVKRLYVSRISANIKLWWYWMLWQKICTYLQARLKARQALISMNDM